MSLKNSFDIVVIGAGAAGIAAGRTLAAAKADFILLEARSRIGGRAWTVTENLPFPLDLGCGWLHSGDRNPWTAIAEASGFTVDRSPAPWAREESALGFVPAEWEDFRRTSEAFYKRVDAAAEEKGDRETASLLETGNRWNPLLHAISTYANGAELNRISIKDFSTYDDSEVDYRVVQGYGAAIAAHAAGLPVELNCAATAIGHGGKTLQIETSRGTIEARAAIVTLPTNLLARGAIRFTPALPEKLQAASGLPLGLANKIYFSLDDAGKFPVESRLFGDKDKAATGAYHFRPLGRPLVEAYFGGSFARELEQAGEGAAAAAALDEMVAHFGKSIRAKLHFLAGTRWASDPWALGSYSHALPDHSGARAELAKPVQERIFFAGEACSPENFSTAHGAYETGGPAAARALQNRP